MKLTDSEIIDQIRKGKKHLFGELIDRYKVKGFTLAVRMLKNREAAEEALQDAFIRAYKALDRFQGASKFGTWFYRILYNVCLTMIGNKNDIHTSINHMEDVSEIGDTTSFLKIEKDIDTKQLIEAIRNIVESIPEKYASVLSLFYFQELTYEEICEITGMPIGTLKTHLFRARALVIEQLSREYQREGILL